MNGRNRGTAAILGLAFTASLAACANSNSVGQENRRAKDARPNQPYTQKFGQPTGGQSILVHPGSTSAPYDRISQSESASISKGICDRNLLETTPNGSANEFIGAAAGPLVGGEIGSGMMPIDHGCVGLTLEYARTNQPVAWQNPGDGTRYQVKLLRTYQASNGWKCRSYTTTSTLDGRSRRIGNTACRLPSGLWQLER